MMDAMSNFALGQAQAVTAHRASVKGSSPSLLASLYCGAVGMAHTHGTLAEHMCLSSGLSLASLCIVLGML